jgi:hypothetical protein
MSKRKIIRRFRAGADEGISIVDDNGETYIHIDLNNETHLSELINMICYNISINGIIDLRNILKSDEFNTLLNNPAKQSISTINEMIQKLSPYSELKKISNIIQLLNSIIQLSSIDTSNKVDEQEIKRQEVLQEQATIQMDMDKENAKNETSSTTEELPTTSGVAPTDLQLLEQKEAVFTNTDDKLSTIDDITPNPKQQREIIGICSQNFTELYNTLLDNYDKIYNLIKNKDYDFNKIQKLFVNLGITLTKKDNKMYISGSDYRKIMQSCHSDKNRDDDQIGKITTIITRLNEIMSSLPANISSEPTISIEDTQQKLKDNDTLLLAEGAPTTTKELPTTSGVAPTDLQLLEEEKKAVSNNETTTTDGKLDADEEEQLKLLKDAEQMMDNTSTTTDEDELNKIIDDARTIKKRVDDLMKEVAKITDSTEIDIKDAENIERDIKKEQNLDSKLPEIFNANLGQIYNQHPVLYNIIVLKQKYKPVYRLALLRAITLIENKDDRDSLIDELTNILGPMNIKDDLIKDLETIKKSELGLLKYGGKIKFNRKIKSSKRNSKKKN